LLCSGLFSAGPATPASYTNVESIAGHGGRIIGAARACGVDGDRLERTTKKLFAAINARARSKKEAGEATMLFVRTMQWGADEIRRDSSLCAQTRRALADVEAQF